MIRQFPLVREHGLPRFLGFGTKKNSATKKKHLRRRELSFESDKDAEMAGPAQDERDTKRASALDCNLQLPQKKKKVKKSSNVRL